MTIALRQRPLARVVMGIVKSANGAWFDPSDLSTLYQDAAGTTPVTAVEQPVGKMLDKSGNGYHATQPITASRPTLSARKNVLLATETLATQSLTTIAATYTLSFTGTGSVTLSGTSTGTLTGDGTDRVSLTFTPTAGPLTLAVSGSVTKAQLELGAVAGKYQRVTTVTDYDTDERYFKKYLRFDGVDDYLNLPYMGLYAGGSASVVAGVYGYQFGKTLNGRVICESLVSSSSPTYAPCVDRSDIKTMNIYMTNNTGAIIASIDMSLPQNSTNIMSVIDSGNSVKSYQNAGQKVTSSYLRSGSVTLDSTTIGKGLNNGLWEIWMGDLYSLIITKSALTDAQRIKCERLLARKAGVTL